MLFFFFKQKTAYEIGTGDWSSDVCSSDLLEEGEHLYKYYVDGQWVINPDEVVYLTIVVSP